MRERVRGGITVSTNNVLLPLKQATSLRAIPILISIPHSCSWILAPVLPSQSHYPAANRSPSSPECNTRGRATLANEKSHLTASGDGGVFLNKTSSKEFFEKKNKFLSLCCTRGRGLKKQISFPNVALGKEDFFKKQCG
jgi:hypothetical protein